jgi:hypothetical protein
VQAGEGIEQLKHILRDRRRHATGARVAVLQILRVCSDCVDASSMEWSHS